MMMTVITQDEAVSEWPRCKGRICFVFALLCLGASGISLFFMFLLFTPCTNCESPNRDLGAGKICGGVSLLLFLVGGLSLALYRKHERRCPGSTTQVIVSRIPAEDLEKSPAPTLPYYHTPHYQPTDLHDEPSSTDLPEYFTSSKNSNEVESCSGDLPDYRSAVQNIDEVYLSFEVGFWTEDVPKTPPPCYEQALEMETLATAAI